MKKLRCLCAVLGLSVLCSTTAYAQWEQTGTTWKYQTNGTYYNDGWHWIDGNNDNIAECYYFGADGIMLANCTTPDNYIVDMNGAWIVDGIVQTKSLADSTSSHDKNTSTSENQPKLNNKYTREDGAPDYEKIVQGALAGDPEAQEALEGIVGPGADGNHNWN